MMNVLFYLSNSLGLRFDWLIYYKARICFTKSIAFTSFKYIPEVEFLGLMVVPVLTF